MALKDEQQTTLCHLLAVLLTGFRKKFDFSTVRVDDRGKGEKTRIEYACIIVILLLSLLSWEYYQGSNPGGQFYGNFSLQSFSEISVLGKFNIMIVYTCAEAAMSQFVKSLKSQD